MMMTDVVLGRRACRLLLAAALLLSAAPAPAQQPSQAPVNAIRQACRSDYEAHCANVPTGGAASLNCLKENLSSLSAPCRQAVGAASGGAAAAPAPAPAAPPAAAAAAAAPAAAAPAPSPMSPRQELVRVRQACGYDFRRYCSGVPFGGGRVIACLEGNADRLSPRCGSTLQTLREGR
jgi:hypothetical protein